MTFYLYVSNNTVSCGHVIFWKNVYLNQKNVDLYARFVLEIWISTWKMWILKCNFMKSVDLHLNDMDL